MTTPAVSPKEAAFHLWRAFASGDPAQIRAALTPDARWIAPHGNATAIASGASAEQMLTVDGMIAFLTGPYRRLFPDSAKVAFTKVVAEGETVVMEQTFQARLANGRDYANRYCWVIETRDGKVAELREYMDTHGGFAQIFGDATPRQLV
jgi:ketosteroid isomerase-like protein